MMTNFIMTKPNQGARKRGKDSLFSDAYFINEKLKGMGMEWNWKVKLEGTWPR
jgi:hypothetical protein